LRDKGIRPKIHFAFVLHLFSFKSPALWAEMNEKGDADCAFSMRNGVTGLM